MQKVSLLNRGAYEGIDVERVCIIDKLVGRLMSKASTKIIISKIFLLIQLVV